MFVIHGVDRFGKVDGVDGEYLVTRFHHAFLMPLVPIGSEWVTKRDVAGLQGRACRLSLKSILAAYLRSWGLASAAVLFGFFHDSALALVAASALTFLGLWSFAWRRTRDRRALRRIGLQRPVLGIALDPLRLPRDSIDLLLPAIQERFDARSGGRSPFEVAQHGATTTDQAAHAFVLLRLLAACDHGGRAFEARVASDRLIDRVTILGDAGEPYRAAPALRAPAMAPLLAGYLLPPHRYHFVLATLSLWASCIVYGPWALARKCGGCGDKTDIARTGVKKLAYESYPQWASRPDNAGTCPTARELAEYGGSAKDAWGEDYVILCNDLPCGAVGIAVMSKGEDRREGTSDDIKSWDQ